MELGRLEAAPAFAPSWSSKATTSAATTFTVSDGSAPVPRLHQLPQIGGCYRISRSPCVSVPPRRARQEPFLQLPQPEGQPRDQSTEHQAKHQDCDATPELRSPPPSTCAGTVARSVPTSRLRPSAKRPRPAMAPSAVYGCGSLSSINDSFPPHSPGSRSAGAGLRLIACQSPLDNPRTPSDNRSSYQSGLSIRSPDFEGTGAGIGIGSTRRWLFGTT